MDTLKKLIVLPEEMVQQRLAPSEVFHVHQPLFQKLQSLQSELDLLLTNPSLPDDIKSKFINDLQQKYRVFFRQLHNPPSMLVEEQIVPSAAAAAAPSALTDRETSDVEEVTPSWHRMLNMILPKNYRTRGQALLEQLKTYPELKFHPSSGELIIQNRRIPGTNVLELINYITRPARFDNPKPRGWPEFKKILIDPNVTKDYFGNAKEWQDIMRQIKSARLSTKLRGLDVSGLRGVVNVEGGQPPPPPKKEKTSSPPPEVSSPFEEVLQQWKTYERF